MTSVHSGRTWLAGASAGVAAWLLGYALTYAIVAPDIRDSPLNRIIEAFEGSPATYEMVGWVFHNAHFARTEFRQVPILGSYTTSFIGDDGFTVALYVIPVGLLILAGIGLAISREPADLGECVVLGASAVPGYLLASVASVFLFEVTIGGATGRPELVPAIILGGIAYPLIFAVGGATAWWLVNGRPEGRPTAE